MLDWTPQVPACVPYMLCLLFCFCNSLCSHLSKTFLLCFRSPPLPATTGSCSSKCPLSLVHHNTSSFPQSFPSAFRNGVRVHSFIKPLRKARPQPHLLTHRNSATTHLCPLFYPELSELFIPAHGLHPLLTQAFIFLTYCKTLLSSAVVTFILFNSMLSFHSSPYKSDVSAAFCKRWSPFALERVFTLLTRAHTCLFSS